MMCDCLSYNRPEASQWRPSVVLVPPFTNGRSVCIDACIASALPALWDAGIVTWGSCCGHGKEPPSVILDEGASNDMAARAHEVLRTVDGRSWTVLAWRLVQLPSQPSGAQEHVDAVVARGFPELHAVMSGAQEPAIPAVVEERDQLRALLERAPHAGDCRSWECAVCHWGPTCDDLHPDHEFVPKACNCFKSSIPSSAHQEQGKD